jgi:Flp pilus assembly pilin Flp
MLQTLNTTVLSATAWTHVAFLSAADRLRNEVRGASTVEYLGVLVLVALIIAAVMKVKPDELIGSGVKDKIEEVKKATTH